MRQWKVLEVKKVYALTKDLGLIRAAAERVAIRDAARGWLEYLGHHCQGVARLAGLN